jgi:hypothetical protein
MGVFKDAFRSELVPPPPPPGGVNDEADELGSNAIDMMQLGLSFFG